MEVDWTGGRLTGLMGGGLMGGGLMGGGLVAGFNVYF